MIKYSLPLQDKTEMSIQISTGLDREETWEARFPTLAEKSGLFDYIAAKSQHTDVSSTQDFMHLLKGIYCLIDFESPLTFTDFLKLFDRGNLEHFEAITTRLAEILTIVLDKSKKKD